MMMNVMYNTMYYYQHVVMMTYIIVMNDRIIYFGENC